MARKSHYLLKKPTSAGTVSCLVDGRTLRPQHCGFLLESIGVNIQLISLLPERYGVLDRKLNQFVNRLRFRHLSYLVELGHNPNLGRAARSLNMAQSTATKMLQEIEEIVDCQLFTRNRRGLVPTVAADALIRRAGLIIAELKAGWDELAVIRAGGLGWVRLGTFPVVTSEFIPKLHREFQKVRPATRFSVEEGDELHLTDALLEGRIDLIVGRIDASSMTSEMSSHILYNEATVVVCGTDNPIAYLKGEELLEKAAEAEWVMPTSSTGAFSLVSHPLVKAGFSVPKVAVETISVLATVGFLKHSNMIGIMPSSIAEVFEKQGTLKILGWKLSETDYPVGIIFRKEYEESQLVELIRSCSAAALAATDVLCAGNVRAR